MRALALAAVLVAGPAFGEPSPPPPKPAKQAQKFKQKKAGKQTVYVYQGELEIKVGTPKPSVVVVPRDGRAVTGRPKSEDRLQGLGPHTR